MCGIAGIYYFQGKPPHARQVAQAMAKAIAHRGGDEEGIYENPCLVLAHQRLSIIDLERGRQPIANEGGSVVVACNGEIYNFRELRQELEERGHRFSTASDVEVIVHLYEDLGVEMLNRLNGIFAFALWDDSRKRLLLARDHLGVKPLHLYVEKNRVLFASEIKGILADRDICPRINKQSIHYFMNLRYVPGRETLVENVERLLPGQWAVIGQEGVRRGRYWRLSRSTHAGLTEAEAVEGIQTRLLRAVGGQLIADVPLGIYLSGGVDSSSVLAMADRAAETKPLVTYALGFNEPTDELNDAKQVADYFHTDHHAMAMDPKPLHRLPEVLWHVEEPKINMIQGYLLAQHARRFTKVALSGLGGDELFAGYVAYQLMRPSEPGHRLLGSGPAAPWARRFLPTMLRALRPAGHLALDEYRRGLQLLVSLGDKCQYYCIIRNVWDHDPAMWSALYGPRMRENQLAPTRSVFEPYFEDPRQGFVQQALLAEMETKLVDDFLLNEDRVSMAHALEVRVPLLDRDFVTFAAGLPVCLKMRGLKTKYIFKKAMEHVLPPFVLQKKKWGFTFNSYIEFQKDLKEVASSVLTAERVREVGLFNYDFIRKVLHHPPHPRLRWHYFTLWMMVGFHLWHDMFIRRIGPCPPFPLQPPSQCLRR